MVDVVPSGPTRRFSGYQLTYVSLHILVPSVHLFCPNFRFRAYMAKGGLVQGGVESSDMAMGHSNSVWNCGLD